MGIAMAYIPIINEVLWYTCNIVISAAFSFSFLALISTMLAYVTM